MSKSCLITGATGMVGSHLIDYLVSNTSWNIFGFCRWNDSLENIEHLSDQINTGKRLSFSNKSCKYIRARLCFPSSSAELSTNQLYSTNRDTSNKYNWNSKPLGKHSSFKF